MFVELLMRAVGVEHFQATKAHANFLIELMRGLKYDLQQAGPEINITSFNQATQEEGATGEHSTTLVRQFIMWGFLKSHGAQIT